VGVTGVCNASNAAYVGDNGNVDDGRDGGV
jgi:hypothetical protein